jgi:uncharacterized protein YbjT (DUF2867 family)
MSAPIFVTGGTGRLGRLIVSGLLSHGQTVRVFSRNPEARALFPDGLVEVVHGDFAEAGRLAAAVSGVEKLLLLSPLVDTLARDQIAVADVASAAGVERIVKISGSHWTIEPPGRSIAGDAHAFVERHLKALPVQSVALRPNAWMQVGLPPLLSQAQKVDTLTPRYADAKVGFIDSRDIADVAISQLLGPDVSPTPLILTGPQLLNIHDIAAILSRLLQRDVTVANQATPSASLPGDGFEHRAVVEFMELIRSGVAAQTTGVVEAILGRPARSVEAFLSSLL